MVFLIKINGIVSALSEVTIDPQMRVGFSNTGFEKRREYPQPSSSIILNLGTPLRVEHPATGETLVMAKSFVAGLSDNYAITESYGVSAGIQIAFTPLGAYLFLGTPGSEFSEQVCHLSDILGPDADLLTEKLASTKDWQTRFDLVDSFIAARFAAARPLQPQVEGAYAGLLHTGGLCSVGSLADAAGWSEKHFVDRFREQVGVAPKTMGRIIRFNRALKMLQSSNVQTLSDVVYEAGYYDQPHMNRDFRQFTGGSPSDFLRKRLPDGAGLRDA